MLGGVRLDAVTGEWLGVIGPNGAGKTTLLRCIAGLVRYRGSVTMGDGRAPGPADVALVPQSPALPVGMTVAEYVLLGRTAHLGWLSRESLADRRIATAVLKRLDLTGLSGRRLSNLSGGEAQRVVLARALAQQARILLLDEPTSALDLGSQFTVLELLDELRRAEQLTVIAAMHDLTAAARFADRLVLIHRGSILSDGPPESVLDARLLSHVYRTRLTVSSLNGQILVLPALKDRHQPTPPEPNSPQRPDPRAARTAKGPTARAGTRRPPGPEDSEHLRRTRLPEHGSSDDAATVSWTPGT